MRKSIALYKKSKRGRLKTGHDPAISTRLPKPLMQALLQWAADNEISRAEALRRLVEHALANPPKPKR